MKNNLGFAGFLGIALMLLVLSAIIAEKLSATTPLEPYPNPTPAEKDPCWYVEFPCEQ